MEKNDKAATTDEPQLNYRGIKAMPFVIGNKRKGLSKKKKKVRKEKRERGTEHNSKT